MTCSGVIDFARNSAIAAAAGVTEFYLDVRRCSILIPRRPSSDLRPLTDNTAGLDLIPRPPATQEAAVLSTSENVSTRRRPFDSANLFAFQRVGTKLHPRRSSLPSTTDENRRFRFARKRGRWHDVRVPHSQRPCAKEPALPFKEEVLLKIGPDRCPDRSASNATKCFDFKALHGLALSIGKRKQRM